MQLNGHASLDMFAEPLNVEVSESPCLKSGKCRRRMPGYLHRRLEQPEPESQKAFLTSDIV